MGDGSPREYEQSPERQLRYSAATEQGENHTQNEDGYTILPNGVVVILDGVSTGGKGKNATNAAIESFKGQITPLGNSQAEIERTMRGMFAKANQNVATNGENGLTTASAAYIWTDHDGKRYITIGHVGDTRIHLVKSNDKIQQLTTDHRDPSQRNLITQYLGKNNLNPQIQTFDLPNEPGQIILTTDGIHDNLDHQELLKVITAKSRRSLFPQLQAPITLAKKIVDAALSKSRNGGKKDDMTAIVIDIPPAQKSKQEKAEAPAPSVEQKLHIDQEVRVQRSDGTFESGWIIREITIDENGNKFAKVELDNMRKYIPLRELERLNRPANFEDINEAENYEQINDILNQLQDRSMLTPEMKIQISEAINKLRDQNTTADVSIFREAQFDKLSEDHKTMLQKAAIRLAPNMDELIRILPPFVFGSNDNMISKTYLETNIRIIEKIKNQDEIKKQIKLITRTHGIRNAVERILSIN